MNWRCTAEGCRGAIVRAGAEFRCTTCLQRYTPHQLLAMSSIPSRSDDLGHLLVEEEEEPLDLELDLDDLELEPAPEERGHELDVEVEDALDGEDPLDDLGLDLSDFLVDEE